MENRSQFDIEDPGNETPCRIVETGGQFHVGNQSGKNIHFLAIDHCFLGSGDGAKADCALFDEQVLKVVELKNPKTSGRNIARKKAIEQLDSFISMIKKEKIDLTAFKVEAIVALSFRHGYPAFTTRNQDAYLRFLQNGVHLLEGNETSF